MQIDNGVTNNNSSIDGAIVNGYNTGGNNTEGASAIYTSVIDRLLTVQDLCELLNVKETYIYWLTHQKKIPHIKMQGHLRFRKSVIDEWIDSQEVR